MGTQKFQKRGVANTTLQEFANLDPVRGNINAHVANKGTANLLMFMSQSDNAHYLATAVAAEAVDTGDGVTVAFTGTLANAVIPGTLVIDATVAAAAVELHDDADNPGILYQTVGYTEVARGTINYCTGAYSITFAVAPDNLTAITADYYIATLVTPGSTHKLFSGTIYNVKVDVYVLSCSGDVEFVLTADNDYASV